MHPRNDNMTHKISRRSMRKSFHLSLLLGAIGRCGSFAFNSGAIPACARVQRGLSGDLRVSNVRTSTPSSSSLFVGTAMQEEIGTFRDVEPPRPDSLKDDFVFGLDESLVRQKGEKQVGAGPPCIVNFPLCYATVFAGFSIFFVRSQHSFSLSARSASGKVAQVYAEGDDLETKPYQVAMVSVSLGIHALLSASAIWSICSVRGWEFGLVESALILAVTSVLADFGSGVFHWSVDNYGNGRTPILGSTIAAFQGHHTAPWTITQRGFCNNVHKLCIPFGPVAPSIVASLHAAPGFVLGFTFFCFLEVMSQEIHKYTHLKVRETPAVLNFLMKKKIILDRSSHNNHHTMPFEGNYCIVTGICNPLLDESGFFRFLEHMVYKVNGQDPNSWKLDEDLKAKTLKGKYALELSDYK